LNVSDRFLFEIIGLLLDGIVNEWKCWYKV
jgi:hypothetical protein